MVLTTLSKVSPEEIAEIEDSINELGGQSEAQSLQIEELSSDIDFQGQIIRISRI